MSRALTRIKHDELTRIFKALRGQGLSIAAVEYDGEKVRVVTNSGDNGNIAPAILPGLGDDEALLEEPEL